MKITLRDVAEAAGVSPTAVSKVLHGTGRSVRISRERAEHIQRIAEELNYRPNHLARSLRNRRTDTIGVVFQHFYRLGDDNPYYPHLLNGIMGALFPAEYTLALCPKLVRHADESALFDGRFDGILWCRPDFTDASVEILRGSPVPVVMMHAPPGYAPGVPTFCADNLGAYRQVVAHLRELGHERLAFVVEPIDARTAEGRDRAAALVQAAEEAGMFAETVLTTVADSDLEPYRYGTGPHTAFVAFSDHLAGRLISLCARMGIRVPHDLSIIGFDSSTFCDRTTPPLTSVYQPVERIAFEATSHLLSLIKADQAGSPAPAVISSTYDCGVDHRGSTAPPSTSSPKRIQP